MVVRFSKDSIFLVVCVACGLMSIFCLWGFEFLPGSDLGQHAAQIRLWQDYVAHPSSLSDTYEINLFTPYLLGYFAAGALAEVMPIKSAIRSVLTLALILHFFAFYRLVAKRGGSPFLGLLGWPLFFGYAFYWGFYNFVVAVPFGLLYLAGRNNPNPETKWTTGLLRGVVPLLLFLAHVLVFAPITIAKAVEILVSKFSWRERLRLLAPILVAWTFALIWTLRISQTEPSAKYSTLWELGVNRLPVMLDAPLTLRNKEVGAWCMALGLVFLSAVGGGFSKVTRREAAILGALLTIYALAPSSPFFTYHFAWRLAVFPIVFGLTLVGRPIHPIRSKAFALSLSILTIGWLGFTIWRIDGLDKEFSGFDAVTRGIPDGQTVCSLFPWQVTRYSSVPPFVGITAWWQSEHGGKIEFSFASYFPELVRFRDKKLTVLPASKCDALVANRSDPRALLRTPEPPSDFRRKQQSGNWVLYQR